MDVNKKTLLELPQWPPVYGIVLTSTPVTGKVRKLRVRWTAEEEQEPVYYRHPLLGN